MIEVTKNQAERILIEEYSKNIFKWKLNDEKEYMREKFIHAYSVVECAKKISGELSSEVYAALLLHDIGRFSETVWKSSFDHAVHGYNLLKGRGVNNTTILLSVKYHETDVGWRNILTEHREFKCLSNLQQNQVISCCEIVKDADIISNMKYLLSLSNHMVTKKYNYELVDLFLNGKLGKDELVNNQFDQIIYILCGLNIINLPQSFSYLRKCGLIKQLVEKLQYLLVEQNCSTYIIRKIGEFLYGKYNI